MKKIYKTLLLILFFSGTASAQSPESFNYQAVIRDASSAIVGNQNIGLQFRVLQTTANGTSVYTETHNTTTNVNGLVALAVGSGASADIFANINWATGPYFLEIAVDITGGSSYSILGTQQLMSVPYALYAKTSGSVAPTDKIVDADNDTKIQVEKSADEDVIRFDIAGSEMLNLEQNGFGHLLISLPSNGTNTFVGNQAGLNSIAGRNTYFGYQAGAGNTTGSQNVAIGQEAGENSQTGIRNVLVGKSSGFGNINGSDNVMLGTGSGSNSSGSRNIFLGSGSGSNELGDDKLYIDNTSTTLPLIYGEFNNNLIRINGDFEVTGVLSGDGSGLINLPEGTSDEITDADNDTKIQVEESADEDVIRFDVVGNEHFRLKAGGRIDVLNSGNSIFLGNNAGRNDDLTGNVNVFIGNSAGAQNVSGGKNIAIGFQALQANVSGRFNVAQGFQTLLNNTSNLNTVIGDEGFLKSTSGSGNIGFGSYTGRENLSGIENVMIGLNAGRNNLGSNNVFLGHSSGRNETGSNKLYIESSMANTDIPLIYGEFDNDLVRINGDLEVTGSVPTGHTLSDANNNTKIQVEESADEDVIRFDLNGAEALKISNNANGITLFEPVNNSNSAMFGEFAGTSLTTGGNNLFIGNRAGFSTTIGSENVYLGRSVGGDNIIGNKNTVIGAFAGLNSLGSKNIFVGYRAGFNELGDDKLYMDNTSTSSPLIYGEFDNDLVRINGDFEVTGTLTGDGSSLTNVIQNTTVNNNATSGQNASIDIINDLEVGQNLKSYGNARLAQNPSSRVTIGHGATALNYIIKVDVLKDVGSIPSDGQLNIDFDVPGAERSSSVIVSPSSDLPNQVFIGQARVDSSGIVRVRFHNESNSSKDPVSMNYYITVIK